MLACPRCQFENSENNKFCEKCGTSLTEKSCPECGASVELKAESCPSCGASVATVWWGMVRANLEENLEIERDLTGIEYLDSDKRYQMISLENLNSEPNQLFSCLVIDRQPLQKSSLRRNWECLEQSVSQPAEIPTIAFPYLNLQELVPFVPPIHDAWCENNKEIILLPDRSGYHFLSELWLDNQISLLEIVCWLKEIAQLWGPLDRVGCSQSLLEETNLRVDEYQSFCLQRLYTNPANLPLQIEQLGKMWQEAFSHLDDSSNQILFALFDKMISGEIKTGEELSTNLAAIADKEKSKYMINNNEREYDSDRFIEEIDSINNIDTEEEDFFDFEEEATLIKASDSEDQQTIVLPMKLSAIVDTGYTDVGFQREGNEDYFCIDTKIEKQESFRNKDLRVRALYVVCDGMGGHDAGEVASAMAVETLQNYFKECWQDELPDKNTIKEGILLANNNIYQLNQKKASSGTGRMGTTLVMVLVHNKQIAIAHVGDSRVYQVTRQGGIQQLTLDHEVGQREILRGVAPEIAYARPDAHQLTQALGPRDNQFVNPDINFFEIEEDTLILICSDGLSDNDLLENYGESYLAPLISSSTDLDRGLIKLIDFANEYNGHDNITGILVRLKVQPITSNK
jgi:protein phosphatase